MGRLPAVAALLLSAAVTPGPAAAQGAAARVPAPVSRIQPTHRLVGLTLRADERFRAWPALLDVLAAGGAQATVIVTPAEIRAEAPALRRLLQSGEVELGLTRQSATGGGSLLADGEEAERLLGDRIGIYQPQRRENARREAEEAYRAGLVTVLWSRQAGGDPAQLERIAKAVGPGEIVRFDLPRDSAAVARMAPALETLRARRLIATSASGLIEDGARHLQYCRAATLPPGAAPMQVTIRTPGVRPPLRRIYPAAGLPARALWHLGRPGELAVRRLYGVKPGVRLGASPVGGLLDRELQAFVAQEARRLYVAPVGATLTHPEGQVVPDRPGRRLDVQATLRRIWAARQAGTVDPVIRIVFARWRTADIEALTDVLGRYRTWIDGSAGRYMNIQKGAGRINNRIVFPGETFSALGVIGDVSRQPGWQRAPVIVWGAYEQGVGGGLCQVSSTLYNAVDKAQLKIVERHHHAKRVHYVPRGRDATIAWPDLDFRFVNSRSTPVVVKAYVRGGALWTVIMGKATA